EVVEQAAPAPGERRVVGIEQQEGQIALAGGGALERGEGRAPSGVVRGEVGDRVRGVRGPPGEPGEPGAVRRPQRFAVGYRSPPESARERGGGEQSDGAAEQQVTGPALATGPDPPTPESEQQRRGEQ